MPLVTPLADSRSDALSSVSSPFLRADCSSLTTLLSRRDADVPVSTHTREQVSKAETSCPDTWTIMGGTRVRITHRRWDL